MTRERQIMAYLLAALFMAAELDKGKRRLSDRARKTAEAAFLRMLDAGKLDVIPGMLCRNYELPLLLLMADNDQKEDIGDPARR